MSYFFAALILSVIFTVLVRSLAKKLNIMDEPNEERKKHIGRVPLLGGLAIFFSFWLVTGYVIFFTKLFGPNLQPEKLFWVFAASIILMVVGCLDDKYKIKPAPRLLVAAACVLIVILGGVNLDKITNPFGGILYLDFWQAHLGILGTISVSAAMLVFFWILGMMFTTKILDGLDGLSSGITVIGSLMIFFIASGERWHQPDVALLALVFAGACLGFLLFNFYPAKIFLGEGGSLFIGFMLGVLSVIAGGKIATALLVMAVPILDLARVAVVRIRKGKSFWQGDREHLHFRLVDSGLSQRQAVLIFYSIAIIFGTSTLFFQSQQKLYALIFLFLLMLALGIFLARKK